MSGNIEPINNDQFKEWRRHPVTKVVFEVLRREEEAIKEAWIDGLADQYAEEARQNVRASRQLRENIDYEIIKEAMGW